MYVGITVQSGWHTCTKVTAQSIYSLDKPWYCFINSSYVAERYSTYSKFVKFKRITVLYRINWLKSVQANIQQVDIF